VTLLTGLPEGEHVRKMENEKQNSVIDVFYSKGRKASSFYLMVIHIIT
jgi:hypothetical protein